MLNSGLVLLRPSSAPQERTIVVSGLARSGTSMVAAMLRGAGLFLGTEIDPVVHEDREIAQHLGGEGLQAVVNARNRVSRVWGFKRPNLHVHGAKLISALRNPRIILTSRDPVTIGRRIALSEHLRDEFACIQTAATETLALIAFAATLDCPILLVSYEKALQDPVGVAETLLSFCGLKADARAVAHFVVPNRSEYLKATERRFIGHLDDVVDGVVRGWAAEQGSSAPVSVELLIDDVVRTRGVADAFRADLAQNGIGSGFHAFRILVPIEIGEDAILSVRVADRTDKLIGSGKRLKYLRQP